VEAHGTLEISPNASAALSRRCLQRLIREKEAISERTLFAEIEKLLARNILPRFLAEDLDSIRHVGNFAAHAIAVRETREIIQVETWRSGMESRGAPFTARVLLRRSSAK